MINNKLINKAENLLAECKTVTLAIVKENGYPFIYAMEKVTTEGLKNVYIITKKSSSKVDILRSNNKACIEYHTEEESISLVGRIAIIEDESVKQQILPDNYLERLNKSGSSRYCVLCFTTEEATLYIDNQHEKLRFIS